MLCKGIEHPGIRRRFYRNIRPSREVNRPQDGRIGELSGVMICACRSASTSDVLLQRIDELRSKPVGGASGLRHEHRRFPESSGDSDGVVRLANASIASPVLVEHNRKLVVEVAKSVLYRMREERSKNLWVSRVHVVHSRSPYETTVPRSPLEQLRQLFHPEVVGGDGFRMFRRVDGVRDDLR